MPVVITNIIYSQLTREDVFSKKKTAANVQSLVSLIVDMQRWELEEMSTSSIINKSIVEHIDNYYANIPLLRNGIPFNDDFTPFILNKSQENNKNLIFCIGDSGCGKSTLLIKTFLDLSIFLSNSDNNLLPIYLNLNNATKFTCDRTKLVRMILSRYKIKAGDGALRALHKDYKFVFLLDGLDEKSTKLKSIDIENALAQRANGTFIISSRINLYRQLKVDGINSLFEFRPIDAKLRIAYFNNFFADDPQVDEKIKQVSNVLSDSQQDGSIFSNILMLTLLAMHIKESPDYILQFDKRRGTVIDSIITATIKREIKKNKLNISAEVGCEIVETVALFTYERQQKGQTYSFSIMNKRVKDKMTQIDSEIVERVINIFVAKNGNTKTYRFIHSQFYDFFVAKATFIAIKKKRSLNKYMSYNFSIDINALLSDLMRDDEPEEIYKTLRQLCRKCLNKISVMDNPEEQNYYGKLHLLIMHMQRTGEYIGVYNFAKKLLHSGETFKPYVEALLLHSKVAGGLKEEDEECFFQKLVTDEGFLARHIGMTLLYYNDELELRLPHYDDGKITYKGILHAYTRHFKKSDTINHYYIARRHNTLTMKTLLEKRKVVPRKVADSCKSLLPYVESDNSTFGLKVKAEYDLLIETINKYPITNDDF
ncbi:NACHT domain-containing NTPase [Bacteroides sp. 519]|uniref:NACHT domain-containing protein n=1 Tax=Bacteroides sp. 519 TaxID=2302937 RepID=UPI0013D3CD57|nr:hypothetical protein [Bacteroides sp. 519]NDV56790.1 hypothetical protein [Bacteroides sp. 519]